MNDCCNFHDLCELWNAHFNTMLSCVSLLVTAFGLVIPSVAAWFQHKSLRDERERWNNDVERKFAELKEQRELISQQNLRIDKHQKMLGDANIALAGFYSIRFYETAITYHKTGSVENKRSVLESLLVFAYNALESGVYSQSKTMLVNVMETLIDDRACKFFIDDLQLAEEIARELKQKNQDRLSVTLSDIVKMVGSDNETYMKFIKKYNFLLCVFV